MVNYHILKQIYNKLGIILTLVLAHILLSFQLIDFRIYNDRLKGIETFEDLHNSKAFSFSIFSDNQGASPTSDILMARANMHIRNTNDKYVLGVGNHLNRVSNNEFLYFVCNDLFWRNNFYPTIADGENSIYGNHEEWGAGKLFFDAIDMRLRNNITFSKEGTDYYALINDSSGYNIHFVSIHYPDQPADPSLAFKQSSKNFLYSTLSSIEKKSNDIIVVAAHSRYGFFTEYFEPKLKKLVDKKCDLVVSGSTHYYERQKTDDMTKGPLILNTGSITNPKFNSQPGFLQVCILSSQEGIHVQYINLNENTDKLRSSPYAYFKSFNGKIYDLNYK